MFKTDAKKFGWTLSKKIYFFNIKFTEGKYLHNQLFGTTLLCKIVFRAETGNNRKNILKPTEADLVLLKNSEVSK